MFKKGRFTSRLADPASPSSDVLKLVNPDTTCSNETLRILAIAAPAGLLVSVARDPRAIGKALAAVGSSRLEPEAEAELEQQLYERALGLAEKGPIQLGGQVVNAAQLRDLLEQTYRKQARLAADPAVRARLVDLANSIRPWSLL